MNNKVRRALSNRKGNQKSTVIEKDIKRGNYWHRISRREVPSLVYTTTVYTKTSEIQTDVYLVLIVSVELGEWSLFGSYHPSPCSRSGLVSYGRPEVSPTSYYMYNLPNLIENMAGVVTSEQAPIMQRFFCLYSETFFCSFAIESCRLWARG